MARMVAERLLERVDLDLVSRWSRSRVGVDVADRLWRKSGVCQRCTHRAHLTAGFYTRWLADNPSWGGGAIRQAA